MHGTGAMGKVMRAIGLMSGTSMDGIDVALLETDGEDAIRRGPSATSLCTERCSGVCGGTAVDGCDAVRDRRRGPVASPTLERQLTERHAEAVSSFHAATNAAAACAIDVIGFHGQTVLHRPEQRLTVQLGDGPLLARGPASMSSTICAPPTSRPAGRARRWRRSIIVRLLARLPERPVAFLNIGGVANVTWIGRDGELLAFDTGPGNAHDR